jgi:extradiol dioxygenase family protein
LALSPFHLAIPVHDLDAARHFYGTVLGCPEGRSAERWVDFDLFGHQLVVHLVDEHRPVVGDNPVDGHDVPVPHFGVVLPWSDFHPFVRGLADAGVSFHIAPTVRFEGSPGEQATCFFTDPSGNALEFKAFRDPGRLFAT